MYTNRKTAPLEWMKVYKFAILPLNIVTVACNLLRYVGVRITFLNATFIFLDLALLAGAVICEIGLIRWKRIGLICVYIIQGLSIIENILVLFLSGFSGVQIVNVFIRILLSNAWITYFCNRTPLFSPDYKDPEPEPVDIPVPTTEAPPKTPQYKTLYCPECGTKLLSDAVFCHNCGRKL